MRFSPMTRLCACRRLSPSLALLAASLSLYGCSAVAPAPPPPASNVCTTVAKIEATPSAVLALDALDPHSAGGVLWANVEAACPLGVSIPPTVSPTWGQIVLQELIALLPSILPWLLPLIL